MINVVVRRKHLVGLIALSSVLLAACNSEGSPTSELPVVVDDLSVIADARLISIQSAQLSFNTGGGIELRA